MLLCAKKFNWLQENGDFFKLIKLMRMRLFLLVVLLSFVTVTTRAQNASATASQTIQLVLNPTIDLRFNNTGSGSTVNMVFNSTGNYANGVISGTQELEVRSNKNFKISVQTDASSFAYTGNQANVSPMPVNNTLFMAVTNNTTGGSIASGFSNYTSLSQSNQDIILNGAQGEDKKLVLAYKARPDWGYASGTYSVGVIYTATQP